MNKQQQISGTTKFNRYPQIFLAVSELYKSKPDNNIKILSFGCSTGKEVETLHKLYFKEATIHGVDINKDTILANNNKELASSEKIKYYHTDDFLKLNIKYDIIFALSVLCQWPEDRGTYTFDDFDKTLCDLDRYLEIGSYLVIYNSKYLFTESSVADKYTCVPMAYTNTGFVKKYFKNGQVCQNYKFFTFKKIDNPSVCTSL